MLHCQIEICNCDSKVMIMRNKVSIVVFQIVENYCVCEIQLRDKNSQLVDTESHCEI